MALGKSMKWLLMIPIARPALWFQGSAAVQQELQLLRAAMGDSARVERCEHLISGDRRGVYTIQPRQ